MSVQLREAAQQLATVLWREHTVYRERTGGVVIRGEHVQRWISLAPAGGKGEILLRAGRILDGGTTAPARSEAVVPHSAGTAELAAACRRLLAETAAEPVLAEAATARRNAAARPRRERRRGGQPGTRGTRPRRTTGRRRHTGIGSAIVLVCLAGVVVHYLWSIGVLS
ncbi:hypothetical protein [Streptomyces sp. NPDC015131]|uniref:hypothetical protein n=1 Tax=Streptomyces sp. NPDC015131 TaxID=3364941 RepID=UPI0036F9014F